MQNRYVGDVGDFGKYGLLRILCGMDRVEALRLGVIWYLIPDETHNKDGKHLGYLKTAKTAEKESFRKCDDKLYDELKTSLIDDEGEAKIEQRCLKTIEDSWILPRDTLFFANELKYEKNASAKNRLAIREAWLKSAVAKIASADIVFLDPDNGIECKSVSRTTLKGPKYTFWSDLQALASPQRSLVVYHHLNRSCSSAEQIRRIDTEFKKRLPDHEISAVIYVRGTRRAFFIASALKHKDILRTRLAAMMASPWNRHFEAA